MQTQCRRWKMSNHLAKTIMDLVLRRSTLPDKIMPPRTVPAVPEKEPIARDKSSGSVIRPPITVEDFAVKKLPRVVFAFDATGSRQASWDASKYLTDTVLA